MKAFLIALPIAILILAIMHYAHLWTLMGFKYN